MNPFIVNGRRSNQDWIKWCRDNHIWGIVNFSHETLTVVMRKPVEVKDLDLSNANAVVWKGQ